MCKLLLSIALVLFTFKVISASSFPYNFETNQELITMIDFDGGISTIVSNPDNSGTNESEKVLQIIKYKSQNPWGGTKIVLDKPLLFDVNKVISMKVFASRVGIPISIKIESDNSKYQAERKSVTTKANEWEVINFNFSGETSGLAANIVIMFEPEKKGDGTINSTYYVDDISFIPSETNLGELPLDFEMGGYTYTDFDGGVLTIIDNPYPDTNNSSAKVGQIVRKGGKSWAGSKIIMKKTLDFSELSQLKMKFYTVKADVDVVMKLENNSNTSSWEIHVAPTKTGEWETLVFDFAGVGSSAFSNVAFMFDFGTIGDGSENSTFLFDDLEYVQSTDTFPASMPINFESMLRYNIINEPGSELTASINPVIVGNNSDKVGQIVCNGGNPNGGSSIVLTNPISFISDTVIKMKVLSPVAKLPVTIKLKNGSQVAEASDTVLLANTWDILSFDFHPAESVQYDTLTVIFAPEETGDGSANSTYYIDDLQQIDPNHLQISLPVSFEENNVDYTLRTFGDATAELVPDPVNQSNTVAKVTKVAGSPLWAGITLGTDKGLAQPIPFDGTHLILAMDVFCPKKNFPVHLKIEQNMDSYPMSEFEVFVTKENEWETLYFNMGNNLDYTMTYDGLVDYKYIHLFFDHGTDGDGSEYYFDNVRLLDEPNPLALLSSVTVNGFGITGFDPNIFNYDIVLPAGTTEIPTLAAIRESATSMYYFNHAAQLPGTSTIRVVSEDGSNENTYQFNFVVNGISVKDISDSGLINIYSHNKNIIVTVTEQLMGGTIHIYNSLGQEVASKGTIGANESIRVNSSGLFLVQITDNNNKVSSVEKLIVK